MPDVVGPLREFDDPRRNLRTIFKKAELDALGML
jgi:hypothetical protein